MSEFLLSRVWRAIGLSLLMCLASVYAKPADSQGIAALKGVNVNLALESERYWKVRPSVSDLKAIRLMGFNAVRIPFKMPRATHANPELKGQFRDRVAITVREAKSLGFFVLLDFHDKDVARSLNARTDIELLDIWKYLLSDATVAQSVDAIEIMNEPFGASSFDTWASVQESVLSGLRKWGWKKYVLVSGAKWSELEALSRIGGSLADDRVIPTFHYYTPMGFTHYKAPWIATAQEVEAWNRGPNQLRKLNDDFKTATAFGREKGRPVILGEFGVYTSQDDKVRAEWIRDVRQLAERNQIGWFHWSFGDDFGAYSYERACWRGPVVAALFDHAPVGVKYCE